ncbi:MAG TPA: hypothetical protein VG387_16960 [Rhizomicrobium sp.]|jgi:hypothetical protein|nr:hypothetical protein [Rhizomicrobium sp.]
MATDTSNARSSSGGSTFLAVLVGAILAIVVALGLWVLDGRHMPGQSSAPSINLNVKAPSTPKGG